MAAAKTSEKPKVERKTSEYVVLIRGRGDKAWMEFQQNPVQATSAAEAMRKAGAKAPIFERFVAVPARSWKPMQRKVEQVTKESWS